MATVARKAWTDERLDDLNAKVDRLDQRVEAGFREIRTEMSAQFRAQNRMMIQLFAGMSGTMLIGFLGVIATILSQT